MTDIVTISRDLEKLPSEEIIGWLRDWACGNPLVASGYVWELLNRFGAPPPPSGRPKPTVEELQAILDSEPTGEKRVFSKPEKVFDNIADALADVDAREATPPPRLREALEPFAKLADEIEQCCKQYPADDPRHSPDNWMKGCQWEDLVAARAALASPDDGWVKVDAEHPLPSDLKENDEVKHVTYYRRRPSAEQGGGEADNALRS